MNWSDVGQIWRMEIRTLLRSRRTVVMAVVLPMVLMPLMLFASRFSLQSQERREASTVYRYAVIGDWAGSFREHLERARAALDSGAVTDSGLESFQYLEQAVSDPAAAVRSGDIHFYIEALGPEAADAVWSNREDDADGVDPGPGGGNALAIRQGGVPLVRIFVEGNQATAAAGAGRIEQVLRVGRRLGTEQVLADHDLEVVIDRLVEATARDLASPSQTAGLAVGRFLTLLIFMMSLTGGSVVAMDILAGEKERGTLETLLTSAVGRAEIIAAKQLVILTTAVFITMLQLGNLYLYTRFDVIPLPAGFSFDLGLGTVLVLVALYLPLAVLASGALVILSAIAKSYKEAQLYFFPLYLAGMVPALAGAIGPISLRSAIVAIPVANSSVAAREVLSGHSDPLFLVISVLVNVLVAFGLLRYASGLLENENLISNRQEAPPPRRQGAPAYRSRVWRWWVVAWGLFVIASLAAPSVPAQLVVNEIGIFLIGSFALIRWYRLDPRKALALRPVRWPVWLLTLLLVGPMHLTGVLVHVLANTIIPFPAEEFAEQLAVLDSLPAWQLFLMIAVLPGICEEVAFRGMLLYGLRRRYSVAGVAVVVGMVFGFFHFDMLRIVTTGTLGIVITAVALLTGSIFPGIILHLGNNALAVWLGTEGLPIEQAHPAILGLAPVVVAVLVGILYRYRTPYPAE